MIEILMGLTSVWYLSVRIFQRAKLGDLMGYPQMAELKVVIFRQAGEPFWQAILRLY